MWYSTGVIVKTDLMTRILLVSAAATAIAGAPVVDAVLTGSAMATTYLADPPPCVVDVNGPGCATAGPGGANATVPGAGATADQGGANFCVNGVGCVSGLPGGG